MVVSIVSVVTVFSPWTSRCSKWTKISDLVALYFVGMGN